MNIIIYLFLFLELNILSFIIKISYFIFMGLSLSFSFFLFLSILKNSFGNKYLSLNKIIAFIYQKTDLNIELILQALNVFDSSNSSKKLF